MPKKKYHPVPVVELLRRMQDISSLILDLAYSVVIFKSSQLQKEVYRLETELDSLVTDLEIQTMLATRDLEDAKANISFLRVGQALNSISDAAADIASIFSSSGAGLPEIVREVIQRSDEPIAKIKIESKCWIVLLKKSIAELEEFFGIDLMGLVRENKWIFSIHQTNKLRLEDEMIVKGQKNALIALEKASSGEIITEDEFQVLLEQKITDLPTIHFNSSQEREIVEKLVKLKNKSELSINLAFSALLLNDRQLANEVVRLEKELDHLDRSLGLQALKLESTTLDQQERIWNLIRLSKALEEIADSGSWLIEPFRQDIDAELHPLLQNIVQKSDEKISLYKISEDSEAVGTSIEEFQSKVSGTWVVAVHRPKKGYFFDPSGSYSINANDTLIIRAYGKSKRRLRQFEKKQTLT